MGYEQPSCVALLNYFVPSFVRERAGSGNVKVPKHKSNLPNTNAPVNILIGEPINASDIKLVSQFQSNIYIFKIFIVVCFSFQAVPHMITVSHT